MSTKQLDRLKSQLLTSGLQQSDNATWQVINQLIDILRASNLAIVELEEGGSGDGITALTTDVVATGPGVAVATIQPNAVTTGKIADDAVTTSKILDANVTTAKIADNNVTYGKIQQISAVERLLGNGDISAPADVQEISLGDNLEIRSGVLEIVPSGGTGVGLSHEVLSDTHSDSIPADAVLGDIITAGVGIATVGDYVHAQLLSNITEDFEGIRAGYMLGFNGNELASGNQGWGAPPPLTFINTPLGRNMITPQFYDGFLQTNIVEDFEGIRPGYMGETPGGFPYLTSGKSGGYLASMLAFVPMPDLASGTSAPLWQRLAAPTTTGQVLQKAATGVLEWSEDLEIDGNADIAGGVNVGSLIASGSVSGTTILGLGSVSTPTLTMGGKTIGVWTDVAFNAADFTASGGTTPTWTLTAPDLVVLRYCYFGPNAMAVQVFIQTSSVASVAGSVTELRFPVPDGRTAVGTIAQAVSAQENSTAVFDVYAGVDTSGDPTLVVIRKFPFGASAAFDQTPNASYFGFTLLLEVS